MSTPPHRSGSNTPQSSPLRFPPAVRTPQAGPNVALPAHHASAPNRQSSSDTPWRVPASGHTGPPVVGPTEPEQSALFEGSHEGLVNPGSLSAMSSPGRDRNNGSATTPADPAGSIGQQTPIPGNISRPMPTETPAQLPASVGATPVLSGRDIDDRRKKQYEAQRSSHIPLNDAGENRARTLVLCFDGTGNKFGTNSNVVRFFNALDKSDKNTQLTYYQPGIGTYLKSQYWTKTASRISTKVDEAIATGLPEHVKSGYKFLMQNYENGDKICLFGFSRGAYTARALSGMIYKVGLLPPDNAEQLDFAFSVYKETDKAGSKLGSKFKRTFARSVMIDFIGVWDTVSSVGIIPRSLPYSTYNDGVKVFRHALALDERRARFRPSIWGEPVAVREELDVEPRIVGRGDIPRDDWVYRPPDLTHVMEVWFTGCHADVGGGSHPENEEAPSSLSNISLRWMIKECFLAGTGILFDKETLRDIGLDPDELRDSPGTVTEPTAGKSDAADPVAPIGDSDVTVGDHVAQIWDQLKEAPYWWFLELLPMLSTLQYDEGWLRLRKRNFGRGRYMAHADGQVLIHKTVKDRMEQDKGYEPVAYNWSDIVKLDVVKWVE